MYREPSASQYGYKKMSKMKSLSLQSAGKKCHIMDLGQAIPRCFPHTDQNQVGKREIPNTVAPGITWGLELHTHKSVYNF